MVEPDQMQGPSKSGKMPFWISIAFQIPISAIILGVVFWKLEPLSLLLTK